MVISLLLASFGVIGLGACLVRWNDADQARRRMERKLRRLALATWR